MFCSRTLRSCCLLLRVVPVLFIFFLVLWSYYAFIIKYFPIAGYNSLIEKACIFIIYHIFFLMFLWCFYETMKTSPSKPTQPFFISSSKANLIQNSDDDEERNYLLTNLTHKFSLLCRTFTGGVRYCSKCKCLKPDRTHHCSVCKRCVLKMDHHCPWVNNCVGFSNYKYFILFLLYATLYCMFCCLALFSDATEFIWALSDTMRSRMLSVHVVALWLIATMFLCGLLILLSLHCYLVLRNQSTIELFQSQVLIIGPAKGAFNLGCYSNLLQVFGPIKKLWLLPIFSSIGDGITFPLNPRYEDEVRKQVNVLRQKWTEEGILHSNSMSL